MKKKLIIPISLVLVILIAVIYISYGFVSARITNNELSKKQTFMNQKLEIEYSDGTETLTSNNTSFIPGSTITKTFSIKNTGNVKLNFKINLDNVTNTFTRKEDITYELYLDEELLISNIYPSANTTLAYNQTLNKNEIKNYTLKIIYNNSEENQIIDQGKEITGKLTFGEQINNLTNLKILGNSIQTGTPSTATPAIIESVGDKTVNLFEYKAPEIANGTIIEELENGAIVQGNINAIENNYSAGWFRPGNTEKSGNTVSLTEGDIVTLSADVTLLSRGVESFGDVTSIALMEKNESAVLTSNLLDIKLNEKIKVSNKMTIAETGEYYPVIATSSHKLKIENIQIEKSSTATEYEPYGKYKIPITVRSINLYKPTRISAGGIRTPADPVILENNVGTTINTTDAKENNFIITQSQIGNASHQENYSNGYFCFEIGNNTLLHKKKYILSFDCEIIDNLFENNNNNLIIAPNFDMDYSSVILAKNGRTHASFTYVWNNVNNDNFIEIRNVGKSLKIKNIMITDVGDSTEYTPYIEPFTQYIYLDEPLRKIGEYEDYIDLNEGKVYRYVEVIDDTGTLPLEESLRGLDTPIIEDIELPSIYSLNPDLKIVTNTSVDAMIEKE